MNDPLKAPHALFDGSRLLVRGALRDVAREAAAQGARHGRLRNAGRVRDIQ